MSGAAANSGNARLAALAAEHCTRGAPRLSDREVAELSSLLEGWRLPSGALYKSFEFADFDATMRFVNALADMARTQDHHPDLDVHYARCGVRYTTHDAGGLTRNDFICAAHAERLAASTS